MSDNRTTEFIDEPDTIRNEAVDGGLLVTDNRTTELYFSDGCRDPEVTGGWPDEFDGDAAERFKPCPHCGKVDTLEFATRRELEDCPNFDDCEAETCGRGFCDVYDNWDCVVCSVYKGGCGASGGYDECPAKAIEKWNTRTPEQAIAATLGSGTLTAEQVRETVEKHWHDLSAEYDMPEATALSEYSYNWQTIADELNATTGGGECECVWNEQEGTFRCSSCDTLLTNEISIEWPSHKVTPITLPNFCPMCGGRVKVVKR